MSYASETSGQSVARAVAILREGGLVGFPTETVYGLAADATNAVAVRRIFVVKGRPNTNPLIVHVADANVARRYARHWPSVADKLAARFWPGPLTLVLPKSDDIVPQATSMLPTVGLRSPNHPVALELLRQFDGPLAAPSANRSNRISPTTAEHVRRELGDAVDLILDGGPCNVGIESTVLDLTPPRPIILRPGQIAPDQIEDVIGPVELFDGSRGTSTAAPSPGQQPIHYSPAAPTRSFTSGQIEQIAKWCREHWHDPATILLIEESPTSSVLRPALGTRHHLVLMPANPESYARRLYAALHDADASNPAAIFIELPPDQPAWLAVRDRLSRATRRGFDL